MWPYMALWCPSGRPSSWPAVLPAAAGQPDSGPAGQPARQVGWALRRLALHSPLPWHRVVNARGCIAMSPSREGTDWIQRELLLAEGIPVDAEGRLPLKQFLWTPQPAPGPAATQDEKDPPARRA